jgi:hypothetical protein
MRDAGLVAPSRIILDAVGRVGDHQVRFRARQQRLHIGGAGPIATEQVVLLAGHGRLLGVRRLGLATVPAIVACGWTDEQKRIYSLADNKIRENGEWNKQRLQIEIGDLKTSSRKPEHRAHRILY